MFVYVSGLTETASILQREGNLPRCSTPPMIHPASPQLYMTPQATPSRVVSTLYFFQI